MGAEDLQVRPEGAVQLCNRFVEVYAASLAHAKAYWVERDTAQGLVRALLDGLRERRRAAFLDTRTVHRGKQRALLVDGNKALPASKAERASVIAFMQAFATTQPDPDFYEVIDVARRIAGTGSLGLGRFVILVRGRGSPDANYLLDLKQCLPSALSPFLKVAQPAWRSDAERVVAVQTRLQAVPVAFLHAVMFDAQPYVLRGLQVSEDRVALGRAAPSARRPAEVREVIETMAQIVAWSHLRSAGRDGSAIADELLDFAQRTKWKTKLLAASEECARQVRLDAATFDAAYDEGVFGAPPASPPAAPKKGNEDDRSRAERAGRGPTAGATRPSQNSAWPRTANTVTGPRSRL